MRFISAIALVAAFAGASLMAQDDLAKFQEHMRAAASANGALGKAIADKDAAAISANAKNAAEAFDWIAEFFKSKSKDDAVTFAGAARDAMKALADAKTPEDITAARAKVGPNCQGCHAVYRAGQNFKGL
jgi:cytochrome c556